MMERKKMSFEGLKREKEIKKLLKEIKKLCVAGKRKRKKNLKETERERESRKCKRGNGYRAHLFVAGWLHPRERERERERERKRVFVQGNRKKRKWSFWIKLKMRVWRNGSIEGIYRLERAAKLARTKFKIWRITTNLTITWTLSTNVDLFIFVRFRFKIWKSELVTTDQHPIVLVGIVNSRERDSVCVYMRETEGWNG